MEAQQEDTTEVTSTQKQLSELQAQGLNQLSTNEREQVFYEIHGVADVIPEDDPTFVTFKLIEFDLEVDRLSNNNASAAAYKQAASSSPDYVKKIEFRLQFLRGDAFDVVAAATRMISFFDSKLELFGPDKLTKDITLQDFDEDDMKCLKTGCMQTLPIRDRSGRAVLCYVPCLLGKDHCFTMQSRLRALWYVYTSMVEDIEVQKRGFVWVHYAVGSGLFNLEFARKMPALVKALPVRAMGVHICFDSPRWRILTYLGMLVGGRRAQTHIRLHFGTHKEVQYELATYGVPCGGEVFPVGPDAGEPRMQHFLAAFNMWQKRDQKDLMVKMDTTHIVPGPNDVLLGRQKVVQQHSGNLHFRIMVNSYLDEYDSTKGKLDKIEITNQIVCIIKETNNGRFLKMDEDSGCWFEVDDMTAREKVAHAFRNQRSKASGKSSNKKKKTQRSSKLKRLRIEEEEDGTAAVKPSKKQRRIEDDGYPKMGLQVVPSASKIHIHDVDSSSHLFGVSFDDFLKMFS